MNTRQWNVVCACLLAFIAPHTAASVVYSYTGNPFLGPPYTTDAPYTDSMFVTATLVLAQPLPSNIGDPWTPQPVTLTAFSISDGIYTITDGVDGAVVSASFTTDDAGGITNWNFGATAIFPSATVGVDKVYISSDKSPITDDNFDSASITTCEARGADGSCIRPIGEVRAYSGYILGSWTVTEVPIPAAVWLFGSGLLGLVGAARRKVS